MRIPGTKSQLAARKERALALLDQGLGPTAVSKAIGASRSTIYEWKNEAAGRKTRASSKPKTGRKPGRQSRLTAKQLRRLEKVLLRGAYAQGYAEDYWTLDRIAKVIWNEFGQRYTQSGVWHVMRRMGWTNQKQQRRALQRDDEKIGEWLQRSWPRIKKVS